MDNLPVELSQHLLRLSDDEALWAEMRRVAHDGVLLADARLRDGG